MSHKEIKFYEWAARVTGTSVRYIQMRCEKSTDWSNMRDAFVAGWEVRTIMYKRARGTK